jgi:hypothetical protein
LNGRTIEETSWYHLPLWHDLSDALNQQFNANNTPSDKVAEVQKM